MSDVEVLAPHFAVVEDVIESSQGEPFSDLTVNFLGSLSSQLLRDAELKQYPEIVALGFWLRPTNIKKMTEHDPKVIVKPLGLVVHYTPANVDTMFIYSWVCSMLMGNTNVVRVATQASEMQTLLFAQLNRLFMEPAFKCLATRNVFLRYPKEHRFNAHLSRQADARVIWGGDVSVSAIRQLPTQPRCRDISFADRYSISLINGEKVRGDNDVAKLADLLWRDTKAFAQQACSSPRIIFWAGDPSTQRMLFEEINDLASRDKKQVNLLNEHLVTSQLALSTGKCEEILIRNTVCALAIKSEVTSLLNMHSGNGLYYLFNLKDMAELNSHIDEKLQTLSYWGVERSTLLKLATDPSIKGVCRIVPVGQALDFDTNWDGYELLSQLSNAVTLS